MPTAYSYIRFSSLGQRRGASEARQEETPEPWCKANGYTLDQSLRLRDRGRSGYHGNHVKHGALGAFLHLIEEGQIERGSILLVEHLDRLTRQDPITGMEMILKIINAGVDIVTLMDGQRYSRQILAKEFTAQIKLQFALFQSHEESDKKSNRLQDVWRRKRERARKGEKVSRRCPAWIDPDSGKIIDHKADVIRRVFKMARDGAGPYKIAATLNGDKVPPIGKGKAWSGALVRYYLTSRTVMGEFQSYREVDGRDVPEGEPVPDFYPDIIDRTTFLHVQQEIDQRKGKGIKGRVGNNKNLFTRLVYNLYDGGRYHYKETHDSRWGNCKYTHKRLIPKNRVDGIPGCMSLAIDYEVFERAFFGFVKEVDVVALFTPRDSGDKAKELEGLQADLIDIDGRIQTYKARTKKSKNIDAILDMIQEAEGEAKAKAKRVEILKSELITSEARIFEDMRTLLDDESARGKVASAIRLLIDRINVLPIHKRTGKHRKVYYILYIEVVFNNGQTRVIITDEEWAQALNADLGGLPSDMRGWAQAVKGPSMDKITLVGFSKEGLGPDVRTEIIGGLIAHASDEWRPLLAARFPGGIPA
jgi:DNA invertase Pin-like site-specific DNA recombinase